ncbi:MAG: riboflavin synthase [Nanoarchaeota archaeon]
MKIGIADTSFARVDMYKFAKKAIEDSGEKVSIKRYTVPGIKDLPAACVSLLKECDIAIALGMPGPEQIDKQCAHEASLGLIWIQVQEKKHILEVFVHLDEGDEKTVYRVAKDRAYKHAQNALVLLKDPTGLSKYAGKGIRQGFENEGSIR